MSEYSIRYGQIKIDSIRGRLIRNPNYGTAGVGLNGWCYVPAISSANKPLFFKALRASIQEEGLRNPVLVWSLDTGIYLTFGGSRVRAATDCGMEEVPAIINDYTGAFDQYPEVTPDNYKEFFKDPPKDVEFGEHGFDYHYNLERARRHDHDPNGFAWVTGTPQFIIQEFPWVLESE